MCLVITLIKQCLSLILEILMFFINPSNLLPLLPLDASFLFLVLFYLILSIADYNSNLTVKVHKQSGLSYIYIIKICILLQPWAPIQVWWSGSSDSLIYKRVQTVVNIRGRVRFGSGMAMYILEPD